jgi:hypothetical protein
MQKMRNPAGLMQCLVLRGCWGWSKDFIPPANPKPQLFTLQPVLRWHLDLVAMAHCHHCGGVTPVVALAFS